MILSIFGLSLSIILWIVGNIGLFLTKLEKRSLFLKMFHSAYYVLLISVILFMVLLFVG
ncbi:hypothetical protein [Staphylococcus agnetis]|uniref:hypothetical protein n=1 Tax=Staphylococcus agnetis TaxID=985762 RepID=UPI0013007EDE|nr:hypothetical protein [Staphylococcus agnetis]MBY7663557.1 hypothetical protein [Staphylococcus agnetis]NJH67689.1 hypothetical protein [Staphylococcus agnetis]NJH80162.1 hypothetical protein [Staphylococcus agnetis]